MIRRRRKPALFVLQSRSPSEPELQDFFTRSGMSGHAILAFLSLSTEEQTRRFTDWQAATLDEELRAQGLDVVEVVSEEAYQEMPWRCRWNREVEFFD
ncbi:hypothetical protein [Roseovarius indicus]|uniref:hypothetical protein n=1 Tax=Roseovarius indicus TaxID=540747 RepID=UPI0040588A3A